MDKLGFVQNIVACEMNLRSDQIHCENDEKIPWTDNHMGQETERDVGEHQSPNQQL